VKKKSQNGEDAILLSGSFSYVTQFFVSFRAKRRISAPSLYRLCFFSNGRCGLYFLARSFTGEETGGRSRR
jgi:hypothetical protein